MEKENGAELAALQQGIPARRGARATGLGKPGGLLEYAGMWILGWHGDKRFCWRGRDFSWPARAGSGVGLSGHCWQGRVGNHRWRAHDMTRGPEKWDERETGAALWEAIGLERAAVGTAQGQVSSCPWLAAVSPGAGGVGMGVPCRCRGLCHKVGAWGPGPPLRSPGGRRDGQAGQRKPPGCGGAEGSLWHGRLSGAAWGSAQQWIRCP